MKQSAKFLKPCSVAIKLLVKNEKKELSINEKDLKSDLVKYQKMNQTDKESIFPEIAKLMLEQAGQAKKIHSHLYKFLESNF